MINYDNLSFRVDNDYLCWITKACEIKWMFESFTDIGQLNPLSLPPSELPLFILFNWRIFQMLLKLGAFPTFHAFFTHNFPDFMLESMLG